MPKDWGAQGCVGRADARHSTAAVEYESGTNVAPSGTVVAGTPLRLVVTPRDVKDQPTAENGITSGESFSATVVLEPAERRWPPPLPPTPSRLFGGDSGQIVGYDTDIYNGGPHHGGDGAVARIRVEDSLSYNVAHNSIFVEVGWQEASIVDRVSFRCYGGFEGGYRLTFDGTVYADWQPVECQRNVLVDVSLATPVKTLKMEGRGSNWAKIGHIFVDGHRDG